MYLKKGNNGDFWDKRPGPFKRYYVGPIYNEKSKKAEQMNSKMPEETSPLPHLYWINVRSDAKKKVKNLFDHFGTIIYLNFIQFASQ